MSELQRETLGSIWRLCDQMVYAAEQGHVETLKAEYNTLKKYMERLEIVQEYIGG